MGRIPDGGGWRVHGRENRPNCEVNRQPDDEEGRIQEARLGCEQRIVSRRIGVRPVVEVVQAPRIMAAARTNKNKDIK